MLLAAVISSIVYEVPELGNDMTMSWGAQFLCEINERDSRFKAQTVLSWDMGLTQSNLGTPLMVSCSSNFWRIAQLAHQCLANFDIARKWRHFTLCYINCRSEETAHDGSNYKQSNGSHVGWKLATLPMLLLFWSKNVIVTMSIAMRLGHGGDNGHDCHKLLELVRVLSLSFRPWWFAWKSWYAFIICDIHP